ncbi:MAG: molecular chaperone DnaJ [Patescibacteria group bacterium]|nr:molecular chaperone DnaJ [Patescibacteria group bacterium]
MSKNYYEVLGVDKKADKDTIKKAFYKLANKYHPDKGGDETKFKEVNEAYQVLSDEKKRKEYDIYGETFTGGPRPGGNSAGGFGGFGGFGQAQDFGNINIDFDDLGDIFGDIFGGFGGFGGTREKRGRDISMDIEINFKESIFGTERNVVINKTSKCSTCHGSGGKESSGKVTCSKCNGNGRIYETKKTFMGSVQTVRNCDECDGVGQVYKEKCSDCKGAGVRSGRTEINIAIPAGINDGEMIKITEQGEAVKGGVSGDMFVKIRVAKDKVWSRAGNDLVAEHKIKLTDALLGFDHTIEGLDGAIDINMKEGVTIGEIVRVSGRGVPYQRKRGDVLIKLIIELPKKLSKQSKKLIEELKTEGL